MGEMGTLCFSLSTACCSVGSRRIWSGAIHPCRERWQAPKQVPVPTSEGETASPSQLCLCTVLLGEGSPSSTPAFKENKTPVGAGGAESHSEEGVGFPASHDSVEEWAWGLLCPREKQIPQEVQPERDIIVTFRASKRFDNLNWSCQWAVVTRKGHSHSSVPAASQVGVKSGMGMCCSPVPCSRGATGPHGGDGEC